MRKEFPLHYQLFIEVMSHISIEANSEDTFSLSKKLSNPNTHTKPDMLSTLVRIQANKKVHKPAAKKVFEAYVEKWGDTPLGDDVDAADVGDAEDPGSDASDAENVRDES